MNEQTSDGLTCSFCGAPDATPQCLPDLSYPAFPENKLSPWGHPRTGNVCRECAVKQMALASAGRLVLAVTPEAVVKAVRALPEKWRREASGLRDYGEKHPEVGYQRDAEASQVAACAAELEAALQQAREPGEPTADELLDALEAELRTGHLRAGTHQWVSTDRTNPTIGRETFRAFARAIIAAKQAAGELVVTSTFGLPADALDMTNTDCNYATAKTQEERFARAIIAQRGGEPTTDAASRTAESV